MAFWGRMKGMREEKWGKMREGKRARRIWFSIWRDAWKEGDKISERRGSRHREKKVKGKTRMFFCLSHLQQVTLQPQSVACLQSGFCSEHTSRCVQKLSAFALSLSTGPEDAVSSSWPIPPHYLVPSTPYTVHPNSWPSAWREASCSK